MNEFSGQINRSPIASDAVRPISIAVLLAAMLPLVLLPLASIFIFGTSKGFGSFLAALTTSEALAAFRLSLLTSSAATLVNVVFGLFAAYALTKYDFWGRNAIIIVISLPTAIPTAVVGFSLLLLWGKFGLLGRFIEPAGVQVMFTIWAIILANIFVTFPYAFGAIKPVFETLNRSLEEAAATIGANRRQTFLYVLLPSLRGAILTGALLTFARALGEFGSTILVSGNLPLRTQTAPLYIFTKFNEGQVEAANAVAVLLALVSFAIFGALFVLRGIFDKEH